MALRTCLLAASRSLPRAPARPAATTITLAMSSAAQKDVPPPANTPSKVRRVEKSKENLRRVRPRPSTSNTAHFPPLPLLLPLPFNPNQIKIALCQTTSSEDKAANIAAATAAIKVRERRKGERGRVFPSSFSSSLLFVLNLSLSLSLSRSRSLSFPLPFPFLFQEAALLGADIVVLPEMWHCPYGNDSFPLYAEEISSDSDPTSFAGSESARALSEAAAAAGVAVVGGSIAEREASASDPASDSDSAASPLRLFNTCLVFGPDGALLARHRKAHLFDIDIPGKITFLESETLSPGAGATTVDVPCPRRESTSRDPDPSAPPPPPPPVVRLGIGICYDLRFPEYAAVMARRGAQVLVYPGAFNTTTGPAHWELLARARAVDQQAFVALCSPARAPEGEVEKRTAVGEKKPYVAHGHSLAVSPWGVVLVDAGAESVGVSVAELDLDEVAERRRNMPLAGQRRGDVYELVDKGR